MRPTRRVVLLHAFKLFDLAALCVAFTLAAWAEHERVGQISFEEFLALRIKVENFAVFLLFLLLWHALFSLYGLYESRRLSGPAHEVRDIIQVTSLALLIVLVAGVVDNITMATPYFLAVFWTVGTGIIVTGRLALRSLLVRLRRRGQNMRYMLIVGTGWRAIDFARRIEQEPDYGYHLLGFADDEWEGMEGFRLSGYPLIASLDEVPALLRESVVDEVVLCLPFKSLYWQASNVVAACEEQGIIVRTLSALFHLKYVSPSRLPLDQLVVTLYPGAMIGSPVYTKRVIDIILSSVMLVVLSPVLLLAAAAVYLDSGRPIFFRQCRRGLNKRPFTMLKFRTMRQDAERSLDALSQITGSTGPGFKIHGDPRITRVGRWLRRLSIDELPQLFNVLKGEMSLVGPRPLFDWEFARISDPAVKRRCSVKPGLTGLWQVSGRSNLPFERRIQLDLQYIDNWSLLLDFEILARTIPAVLTGRGAT